MLSVCYPRRKSNKLSQANYPIGRRAGCKRRESNAMKLFKLTIRNILANGLKTWLTVFVLSIAFMLIIFMQGMMQGWDRQAIYDTIKWEIAGGQYWSAAYDPYDPFTLDSAAALIPSELQSADKKGCWNPY